MAWLNLLWPLALVTLIAWVLGVIAVSLYLGGGWLGEPAPRIRERRLMLLAGLPWMWAILLVLTVNSVSLFDIVYRQEVHCLSHSHGHLHTCSSSDHLLASGAVELTVVGTLLFLVAFNWARIAVRERGLYKRVATLSRLSPGRGRLRILDDVRPLALAVGVRDSFVLLSRGLLGQLTLRQRRVVLAHEVAHLRRGDTLRNVIFEVMLSIHPFWQAKKLRHHWRQALEEGADDSAVQQFGREAVAETLIQVARLSRANRSVMFSMSGAGTIHRIQRLLAPSTARQPIFPWLEALCVSSLVGVVLLGIYYHHGLETLVHWLTGG
jgi:Zn-dependent protease with chaperone function